MQRIISISLSVLLVMSFCSWSTSRAYNVKPSNYHQKGQTVSKKDTNGHYRKYNPDYDDWLFYVHDLVAEDHLPNARRRKRGFYETISNFTRTSVYNLFNWGKLSFSSSSTTKNDSNNDNDDTSVVIIKNVTPTMPRVAVNEVTEEPSMPIPRVRFRKVVEYIMPTSLPETRCKCTSSDRNHHQVRLGKSLWSEKSTKITVLFFSSTHAHKCSYIFLVVQLNNFLFVDLDLHH